MRYIVPQNGGENMFLLHTRSQERETYGLRVIHAGLSLG